MKYDIDTGERVTSLEQAHTFSFAVSPNEEFIVYEERDTVRVLSSYKTFVYVIDIETEKNGKYMSVV